MFSPRLCSWYGRISNFVYRVAKRESCFRPLCVRIGGSRIVCCTICTARLYVKHCVGTIYFCKADCALPSGVVSPHVIAPRHLVPKLIRLEDVLPCVLRQQQRGSSLEAVNLIRASSIPESKTPHRNRVRSLLHRYKDLRRNDHLWPSCANAS